MYRIRIMLATVLAVLFFSMGTSAVGETTELWIPSLDAMPENGFKETIRIDGEDYEVNVREENGYGVASVEVAPPKSYRFTRTKHMSVSCRFNGRTMETCEYAIINCVGLPTFKNARWNVDLGSEGSIDGSLMQVSDSLVGKVAGPFETLIDTSEDHDRLAICFVDEAGNARAAIFRPANGEKFVDFSAGYGVEITMELDTICMATDDGRANLSMPVIYANSEDISLSLVVLDWDRYTQYKDGDLSFF